MRVNAAVKDLVVEAQEDVVTVVIAAAVAVMEMPAFLLSFWERLLQQLQLFYSPLACSCFSG